MTPDTARALAIIKPLADSLRINVSADNIMLYIDDSIGIGIACNSTYATVMEFIGYVFATEYEKRFRSVGLKAEQREIIKNYWFTPEQLSKLKKVKEGAGDDK